MSQIASAARYRLERPRVQHPFDHLAVLAGNGGEDSHTHVHPDS